MTDINRSDLKGGAMELAEKHSGPDIADVDLQSEEDFSGVDSRMNVTKWMACIALGLSYTTAIQQHSCTATIVKHIDIALGNFLENAGCSLTPVGPTTYYNWMISGHNVTVSLILPLAGGLSDIFGRRYFFLVGCSFSLIGTIVALAATSTKMVIAGMVLKGIGSGAQQLAYVEPTV
jgi:MFS family permease